MGAVYFCLLEKIDNILCLGIHLNRLYVEVGSKKILLKCFKLFREVRYVNSKGGLSSHSELRQISPNNSDDDHSENRNEPIG